MFVRTVWLCFFAYVVCATYAVAVNQSEGVQHKAGQTPLFSWPIAKERYWISSFFGKRKRPNGTIGFHYGVDLAAFKGTPVFAASSGKVIQVESVHGYGNMILIAHNDLYQTRYAHLDSWCVEQGQKVQSGQKIGFVGDTGLVRKKGTDASHLHFEIHKDKKPVNPLDFLDQK